MNELLKEVEELLKKPVGQNFHQYRDIYRKVFGREANGCKCKSLSIQNEINNWYILNKNQYDK